MGDIIIFLTLLLFYSSLTFLLLRDQFLISTPLLTSVHWTLLTCVWTFLVLRPGLSAEQGSLFFTLPVFCQLGCFVAARPVGGSYRFSLVPSVLSPLSPQRASERPALFSEPHTLGNKSGVERNIFLNSVGWNFELLLRIPNAKLLAFISPCQH